MMQKIAMMIVFGLLGMASTLVAQVAVIDISQTIMMEGSALNISVIIHQADKAFFTIDLIDNNGRVLENHVINPAEGVSNYALAVPVDIEEQAWLVIRNGDQTQLQELLILPRPTQLIEQTNASIVENPTTTADQTYMQTESICLQENPEALVYLSSSSAAFKGIVLEFDEVKNYVNYPVQVESGQINQSFLFDATALKSIKMTQSISNTAILLTATNAGSALFAVNKLTNLPEKLDLNVDLPIAQSMFSYIDEENKKWLANQLLIDEVLTPLSDKDFSTSLKPAGNTNWASVLEDATINLNPQDYVAFDDVKSFIIELAYNLRLYPAGEVHGSYVYPIQKKPSIRQPLYLIDGQIAVVDDLLVMKQADILSIQVYTELKPLIQTLGPVASAGLIIVKSVEPNPLNNTSVGQILSPFTAQQFERPLSPVAFMGASSQNCYEHNMRLGVFNLKGVSIDGQELKLHSEQIYMTPLAK